MTTTLFTSVEQPVRDWLRTVALDGIDDRVYVGLPTDATYPAIEVTLIDGGIATGETPVANAAFSFSVWAGTKADRTVVADAAWALASLLQSTNRAELDDGVRLMGAQITLGPVPRFDADGLPRYMLDAALTLVKVA